MNFLYELVANPSGTWAAASMPTRIVAISLSVALIYMIGSAIVRAISEGDAEGAPQRAGDVVRAVLSSAT